MSHALSITPSLEGWSLLFSLLLFILSIVPQKKLSLMILFLCVGMFINQQQIKLTERRISYFSNNTISIVAKINDISKNIQTSTYTLNITIKRMRSPITQWHNAKDRMIIYTKKGRLLSVDDSILIQNFKCSKIQNNKRDFLKRNNYSALAFFPKGIIRIKHPPLSIKRFIHKKKNAIRNKIKNKLTPKQFNLFSSIFLGKKEQNEYHQIKGLFNSWGITHYLARSGLHLAIIFILMSFALGLLLVPVALKTFAILIICIIYALLSWSNISFIRSLLLVLGYQLCTILKVPINSIHLLNIVLLICIFTNPSLIFALDFQLTFILTYALILINKYKLLNHSCSKLLQQKQFIS